MFMKVLDTSAVLRSDMDFSDGDYIMPQSVLDEISGGERCAIDIAIRSNDIKIVSPGSNYLERVKKTAEKTGDISTLSGTDIDVIAIALQESCPIMTDDYAIQNVASTLGLTYEKSSQNGIKKLINWKKVCTGCGKEYASTYKGDCPVCGSGIKRRT